MTAHMGMFEVKGQVYGSSAVLRPLVRIQSLSPFHDLMACCTRSSSHTVAAYCGCANIPRPAGWGAGGRDHSYRRLLRPAVISVRPPGSGRTDQVRADGVRSSPVPPLSRLPL